MTSERTNFMKKQTTKLYICRGKDCRKHVDTSREIQKQVSPNVEVCSVRCQKICSPQVVGVRLNEELVWVKKIKTRKDIRAIKNWVEDGKCPSRLKSRRVKKRKNKLKK